jgi:segregation and condensation protein A
MSIILEKLKEFDYLVFSALFNKEEGRQGVVVSFIAVLELCKEGSLDISQSADQSEFQVRGINS